MAEGSEEEKLKLIITEEKGMFKPDDTFWIDKYLAEAIGISNPKQFTIKLTSSTGNTKVVKAKTQIAMGANISAINRCLKSYGFNVGEVVTVETMD